MITYRWVFLNGKKGAANISPPHFHRVCKFNGLKSLDKSVQLLSQAGDKALLALLDHNKGRKYHRRLGILYDLCPLAPAVGANIFFEDLSYVVPRREIQRGIIEDAIESGELKRATDPELLIDALNGPLVFRWLQGHAPLDRSFAEDIFEKVIRAFEPR